MLKGARLTRSDLGVHRSRGCFLSSGLALGGGTAIPLACEHARSGSSVV